MMSSQGKRDVLYRVLINAALPSLTTFNCPLSDETSDETLRSSRHGLMTEDSHDHSVDDLMTQVPFRIVTPGATPANVYGVMDIRLKDREAQRRRHLDYQIEA